MKQIKTETGELEQWIIVAKMTPSTHINSSRTGQPIYNTILSEVETGSLEQAGHPVKQSIKSWAQLVNSA